jgi:hypothetical protein
MTQVVAKAKPQAPAGFNQSRRDKRALFMAVLIGGGVRL